MIKRWNTIYKRVKEIAWIVAFSWEFKTANFQD